VRDVGITGKADAYSPSFSFPHAFISNIPCVGAATRTRCIGILAAVALHVLLLACLRSPWLPEPLQQAVQERLLTVILAPGASAQSLPPDVPEKPKHARPVSHPSSRLPTAHRQGRPVTEALERPADKEDIVGEVPLARAANHADKSKLADSSNNVDLKLQPQSWASNFGALDHRWLPRDSGRVLSGAARPNPGARTNEDKFERAVSGSARTDCRTRYAHMGLLAIPFLLNDTASDEGCKW
jgi:hypothetical protein